MPFCRIYCCLLLLVFLSQEVHAQFTIGGSASANGGGCYTLTPALNSQAGYVYENAALNLNEPFDFIFDVNLGSNNGGADGIVFVLRPSLSAPFIGTGGGALGYNGAGFTTSIGIEVDTWFNGGFGDIAADHIGIFKNGSVNHNLATSLAGPIQASSTAANVEDGNYHTFNVRWDPATTELEVYFDCDYRLQYVGDLIDSVFQGDSMVHWGFVGTTGGANNLQQFCFTSSIDSLVIELEDDSICQGDTVHLLAGPSTLTYIWSPAATLSSPTSNKPVATPTTTTTYYVTISNDCDSTYDTVTVSILDPGFEATASIADPLCKGDCDGSIDVTMTGGNGAYGFLWNNAAVTEDLNSVCPGVYKLTVTDTLTTSETYLCTKEFDWTVDQPDKLVALPGTAGNTSCPDGSTCDGEAQATASGGTTPYQFIWSSGEIGNQAQTLCADTNWVSVTDDNGCEADTFVIIGIPDSIQTTAYRDTMICITGNAALTVASAGGTSPYTYVWMQSSIGGDTIAQVPTTNVSPEVTTQYFVYSEDSKGCVGDTSEVLIKVRPPLGVEMPRLDTICPYDTISFTVQGTGGDSSYAYAWSHGDFGPTIEISPNSSRWFVVTVADVCGTPVFIDSVYQQVAGYPPINAHIEVEEDSICAGESVYLIANASGGYNGPDEYRYAWSHTSSRNNIQFEQPLKTTSYVVTITDLCLSTAGLDTVTIFLGETEFPEILVQPNIACEEANTEISVGNVRSGYYYEWNMGDGNTIRVGTVDSVLKHRYSEVGCYDLQVDLLTNFGCSATTNFPCAVQVLEQPTAAFNHFPEAPTNLKPLLYFQNQSINASEIGWYIHNQYIGESDTLQYEFYEELNEYPVKLIATSIDGCTDTLVKRLPFGHEMVLYWPNSFSPNGDGVNDVWKVEGDFSNLVEFDLRVFDRWGKQVFRSNNPRTVWNGANPTGDIHVSGSYPMTLRYRADGEDLTVLNGVITISKSGTPVGLR